MSILSNIAFIDIETVPAYETFDKVPTPMAQLFMQKLKRKFIDHYKYEPINADEIADLTAIIEDGLLLKEWGYFWKANASFYAEFNRIVCISVGVAVNQSESNPKGRLFIKTMVSMDEASLLMELSKSLQKINPSYLCAHNGSSFDFPVLTRKYMIHGLTIPDKLNIAGKKPWETSLVDTMQLWSCGEYRYMVSLDLLAHVFGLPSPKANMKGSEVAPVFAQGKYQDIGKYCTFDVATLVNCYCRMMALPIYEDSEIDSKQIF